jgi:hypothetical protein
VRIVLTNRLATWFLLLDSSDSISASSCAGSRPSLVIKKDIFLLVFMNPCSTCTVMYYC